MYKDVHNERMQKNNQKSLFVNRALPWRFGWVATEGESLELVSRSRCDGVEVTLREGKNKEMRERERLTDIENPHLDGAASLLLHFRLHFPAPHLHPP
jgi:hypothetical protein